VGRSWWRPESGYFEKFTENPEAVLLRSIVVYGYKQICASADHGSRGALLSQAFGFHERELALDIELAASAGKSEPANKLPMGGCDYLRDSACQSGQLITSDGISRACGVTVSSSVQIVRVGRPHPSKFRRMALTVCGVRGGSIPSILDS